MTASLSTHVLDTGRGEPAAGVRVELVRDGEVMSSAETNGDGRIPELGTDLEPGVYRLVFHPPSPFFRRVPLRPPGHRDQRVTGRGEPSGDSGDPRGLSLAT